MKILSSLAVLLILAALFGTGCDSGIGGTELPNQRPEIYLSSGPLEGEPNTNYKVHFYWNGYDPDGRVDHFQYMITDDEVTGSLIIDEGIYHTLDELGYQWFDIDVHDSIFVVSADSIPCADCPEDSIYIYGETEDDWRFLFRAQHTFFIRAVDEDGAYSSIPKHRTFTATTIAPEVRINHPSDTGIAGGYDNLPPDIFFRWAGNDSVGDGTIIEPDSTRFTLINRGDLGLDIQSSGRLLEFPDSVWSIWRHWEEVDSLNENVGGTRTLITGLTPLQQYIFLVQAKDEAGAISSHFEDGVNMRKINVISSIQPLLLVRERALGVRVSDHDHTFNFTIAEDQPLELNWQGSAEHYGSEITGYRYGWDILDTDNDEEWTSWSLSNTSTEASFVSGTHNFYVECRDYSGTATRIIYDFFVVPFTMEEELLFIDDYSNEASDNPNEAWPLGEPYYWITFPHDNEWQQAWWNTILDDYPAYVEERDFFRITITDDIPPFELVANYKRLIWEVKEETDGESALARVSKFVDSYVVSTVAYDYLSAFMDRGGQLLLCGVAPVHAMLPMSYQMGIEGYERKQPMAFLRHLGYSQGSPEESRAAVERFLPWKQFGVDATVKPVDQVPKDLGTITGLAFPTRRTFWGMTHMGYTGEELAHFPNTQEELGDTLLFRSGESLNVYDWFEDAGYVFNDPDLWEDPECEGQIPEDCHHEFGLSQVEVYNWDWFGQVFDPPLNYRTDQFIPLLTYVPADNTTRWGTEPAETHIALVAQVLNHYEELKYTTGGQGEHTIALVGMHYPDTPSVLLGFPPFFIDPPTAQLLLDHILIDIFGMQK